MNKFFCLPQHYSSNVWRIFGKQNLENISKNALTVNKVEKNVQIFFSQSIFEPIFGRKIKISTLFFVKMTCPLERNLIQGVVVDIEVEIWKIFSEALFLQKSASIEVDHLKLYLSTSTLWFFFFATGALFEQIMMWFWRFSP